jgi:HAD domain in Swiss Army Knife RNA repair proteins
MRLVFLDIDGVLNLGWVPGIGFDWREHSCVEALNQILEATDAVLVISSSWRLFETQEDLKRILLAEWGIRGEIVGATPEINFHDADLEADLPDARITEIRAWLNQADRDGWVESFVVLDDQNIRLDVNNETKSDAEIETRFLQTDMTRGLTQEHVPLAIAHLLRPRETA